MAEDPGQIREAIEQTRADIGETVQAIGDKADVKGRTARKAAAGRDQLKKTSSQAQTRLAEMGRHVQASLPEAAHPVVPAAAEGVEAGASGATRVWRRQPWLVWATAAAASLVVVARLLRRGHD
jgi:uncharacterized protein DUF3618